VYTHICTHGYMYVDIGLVTGSSPSNASSAIYSNEPAPPVSSDSKTACTCSSPPRYPSRLIACRNSAALTNPSSFSSHSINSSMTRAAAPRSAERIWAGKLQTLMMNDALTLLSAANDSRRAYVPHGIRTPVLLKPSRAYSPLGHHQHPWDSNSSFVET